MIHLEVCLSWRTIVLKNNENCRIGTVNKSLPTKVRLENIGAEEIKVSENKMASGRPTKKKRVNNDVMKINPIFL